MNSAPRLWLVTEPSSQESTAEDCIRTATAADFDAVHAFLARLSPEARYRRFFTPLSPVPRSTVNGLIVETSSCRNLIALRGDEVIGHAMASVNACGDAEFAMVVADNYRRRGIATRLMWPLIDQVMFDGARRLKFEMLSENYIIRDWLARCFPGAEYSREYTCVTMFVPLRPVIAAQVAA